MFAIHRDGLYEAPEMLSIVLRRAPGETAAALGEDPGQVLILDSDGKWVCQVGAVSLKIL